MNGPSEPTRYPPPEPERVEQALSAMRERRAKRRRVRIFATSAVVAVVVVGAAVTLAPNSAHRLRVEGTTSPTTAFAPTTTLAPTTTPAPATTSAPSTTSVPTTTQTTTTQTTTTLSRSATQQITYQPFTTTGTIDSNLRVTSSASGTCIRYLGSPRYDYRCFASPPAGGIYDPCFAGPFGTARPLVCPSDPTTPNVVAFTATSVSSDPPSATAHPWAMQLSDGEVCLFVSAAWSGLGPYGCGPQQTTIWADCRQPQPSQPAWVTTCQTQETATSPFVSNPVDKVWF